MRQHSNIFTVPVATECIGNTIQLNYERILLKIIFINEHVSVKGKFSDTKEWHNKIRKSHLMYTVIN